MTPPAEVHVDAALIRQLLAEQFPALADAPVVPLASGWDNQLFRVGARWIARMPRRAVAVPLLQSEQRWLSVLGPRLPLPTPAPHRVGVPGAGYPWPWSLVPHLVGEAAAGAPLPASNGPRLGAFLAALAGLDVPADAPNNPNRGVALQRRADRFDQALHALARGDCGVALDPVRRTFERAAAAPVDEPPRWLHGDLHPRNVLVHEGRLAGIIDWGDVCVGDRSTDLASAWLQFDGVPPHGFWHAAGDPSAATRLRARGWALWFGAVLLQTGLADGDPDFERIGRTTLLGAS
ncbi:MAG: aminoglycoside phosphotransferase family protein [Myxococcales bacterium]|nr:aminoglycoside phosphotransferase family protein [Myxococcales bacterium]